MGRFRDQLFNVSRRVGMQVRSPVSGEVEAINKTLLDEPDLINQMPFTDGWVVRMRADRIRQKCQVLMRGKQARDWFRCEIDRLIGGLLSHETTGPVLPDGAELVGDLSSRISDRAWSSLTQDFFGSASSHDPAGPGGPFTAPVASR